MIDALSVETARQLLDFTGGRADGIIRPHAAEEQLLSAVAIHNLLARQGVAYLADEVGMGKTYVALGALALFRHYRPHFRVLIIAPRENIQDKWMREWRNFVRHIVRVEDLAVKGIGGEPVRALVKAATLPDLVTKVSRDHDRDFFARLTSFSLPLSAHDDGAQKPRQELLRAVPWLNKDLLHLRPKETYKRNFGMAVNCALPAFDLVIVDEGHNLKAGWKLRGATRNVVIGCALGGKEPQRAAADGFHGYGLKARRVLFLSATPIEHDYVQLWNQLDLLGHGHQWARLADTNASDEERRELLRGLLIRRVGRLKCGDSTLTKNQYRREWRHGGAEIHDEPLAVPDDRQKLAVALIQKKVSEVLGHGEHNHSFQVGLLASFESFEHTARNKLKQIAELPTVEAEDQEEARAFYTHPTAEHDVEIREGPDINVVNAIAADYQRRFLKSLPHPKMDALVERLSTSFSTGQKALVFVRRVASVDELQRKLEERYDALLFERLMNGLRAADVRAEMERQFDIYQSERGRDRHSRRVIDGASALSGRRSAPKEVSNTDSFFAWFFRGEGPPDVLSGAKLAERLDSDSGDYGTFFEDNYLSAVLEVEPGAVLEALCAETGLDLASLRKGIKIRALRHLPASSRTISLFTFRAFQQAGLELLRELSERRRDLAAAILGEVFTETLTLDRIAKAAPEPDKWLSVETFFSGLRRPGRDALRAALWPAANAGSMRERVRESEIRRMLLATMVRKGHPIVDLFLIVANRIGTLQLRKRDVSATDLASELLDVMQQQMETAPGYCTFTELADAASNFHLLLTQNLPDLQPSIPLSQVPTLLGRLLRSQKPVGGMAGSVNGVMVRQFRMPGYPLILISTDLLQEGEDLHTFCSSIFHYGIAWMPSGLEQRVGRIDRVGSQTERRLAALTGRLDGRDRLQVYYPHLRDTVEVLQVRRVLHRLNRFLKLMHENLGLPEAERPSIDLKEAMLLPPIDAVQINEPLVSSFDVTPHMLQGSNRDLSRRTAVAADCNRSFEAIADSLSSLGVIEWAPSEIRNQRSGNRIIGNRRQPFTILLRSLRGFPALRCVSPVGEVFRAAFDAQSIVRVTRNPYVRVSLVLNERIDAYEVAVEGDVLYHGVGRQVAPALVKAVTDTADAIELLHQELDPQYEQIVDQLAREVEVER